MHIKSKYIQAVEDAIDFITHNVDGADDEQNESETLSTLRELVKKMSESQYKKRVNYKVFKGGFYMNLEKKIEKAIEYLQPINYNSFDIGYFIVLNGNDMGNSDYCKNCIGNAVKKARKYHFEQRQLIKDDYNKLFTKGIWRGKKVKKKYSHKDIMRSMRSKLKEYPAKASFTYEGHDPDFGGGLHEPCSCENCGEYFTCNFVPNKDEVEHLLYYVNHPKLLTDRNKWEIEIALDNYQYVKDDVKLLLEQVAEKIIKSF